MPDPISRTLPWRVLLSVLAMGTFVGPGCDDTPPPPPSLGEVKFSLLAVGDTGRHWSMFHHLSRQRMVANGITREDRRAPADALLLLGDNFYDSGLRADEMVRRLREDLVEPYCRFVKLAGVASGEVADACRLAPRERRPIPIYAVLGNHDRETPESPTLEQVAIPWFVSNWHMSDEAAEAFDLGQGVSLILFDSEILARGKGIEALSGAIREAEGPWRILVMHRPIKENVPEDGHDEFKSERYIGSVERAIRKAGVPVQVAVSGHEHNLQILEPAAPYPPLSVIAGSGSRIREIVGDVPERRFGLEELGFVRLDLVTKGETEKIVVSVFAVESFSLFGSRQPRLVARWAVGKAGKVHREPLHGVERRT